MKLYYTPGACSLATHIALNELGRSATLEKVDLATKRTEHGADFNKVTAKGYVPALALDDGTVLTEGTAILQYLADLDPGKHLAPPNGTIARYQLQALLGYINSELHKSFGPLFNPSTPADVRAERIAYLQKRYAYVEDLLRSNPFLTGQTFTIADAYLFVVTSWAGFVHVDLSAFPHVAAFQQRVAARPAVIAALKAEGLHH